jgi:pimeloyl-ACP methyl ester carboxylesterase
VFFEAELRRLDLLRELDRIKCPTLIVAGEDDPITAVADMEEIAAAMPRRRIVRCPATSASPIQISINAQIGIASRSDAHRRSLR